MQEELISFLMELINQFQNQLCYLLINETEYLYKQHKSIQHNTKKISKI